MLRNRLQTVQILVFHQLSYLFLRLWLGLVQMVVSLLCFAMTVPANLLGTGPILVLATQQIGLLVSHFTEGTNVLYKMV